MDSIRVSEAPDTGSIPVEATKTGKVSSNADFSCFKYESGDRCQNPANASLSTSSLK